MQLLSARVRLFDPMLHSRHLLMGGAQPQLLLVLDALTEMQNGLQREMERHISQPGNARSFSIVSASGAASPGFCIRKWSSSGISVSALSKVESLPLW